MKMFRMRFFALAFFCACMFGAPLAASAHGGPCPYAYGEGLSQEQMDEARRIYNENFVSMNSTRQALAARYSELDQLLASQNPDRDRIETLSREIGELRGKLLAARAEVRSKLQERGLPDNFYGRGAPRGGRYYYGGQNWHHGGKHGPRGPRGGCGCW